MNREEKIQKIKNGFPSADAAAGRQAGEIVVTLTAESLPGLCRYLKDSLGYDYLRFLTCIDYHDRLEMRYFVHSYNDKSDVVIKTVIDRSGPKIGSVAGIWRTADWHEREAFDFFGVIFEGHPDLRHILLEEDFKGCPLLKDFKSEKLVPLPKL